MPRLTIADVMPHGADEVLVRVGQFDKAGKPTRWQAIVRHKNRSLGWAVAVDEDADEALQEALAGFLQKYGKRQPPTRRRVPVQEVPQGNTTPRPRARVRRPAKS